MDLEVFIDEHDGTTRAEAGWSTVMEPTSSAPGPPRRNPHDIEIPEIGDELAVSHALNQLVQTPPAATSRRSSTTRYTCATDDGRMDFGPRRRGLAALCPDRGGRHSHVVATTTRVVPSLREVLTMSDWYNSLKAGRIATRSTATRTRRSRRAATSEGLRLQALPVSVSADLDLLTPTMRVVVVEDLCWALARHAWLDRRPRWWRPVARRAWAAERAALDAKQARLRELAEAARTDTVLHD